MDFFKELTKRTIKLAPVKLRFYSFMQRFYPNIDIKMTDSVISLNLIVKLGIEEEDLPDFIPHSLSVGAIDYPDVFEIALLQKTTGKLMNIEQWGFGEQIIYVEKEEKQTQLDLFNNVAKKIIQLQELQKTCFLRYKSKFK